MRALAAAVLALALAACSTKSDVEVGGSVTTGEAVATTTTARSGGGTSTTSATTAPSGSSTSAGGTTATGLRTVTGAKNGSGFSMGVPQPWTNVDISSQDPADVARKIAALYPNGADVDTLTRAIESGLVLFAIDQKTGANVNVLVQDQTASLDLIAGQIDAQLGPLGATPATVTRPTIAGREALRADTTIPTPPAALSQFYIVTDAQTYIVTVTTPQGSGVVPIDDMAASIALS